ncbi:MAG TPA: NAD(P)-dependent oxidoreductase, partial [Solirubrobacteraceae bacterium]|nr:NAD(P)-dependent oxidoreductase [Solirubrobacteraceae bacterium]
MNVLVTGGTGHLGSAIVTRLDRDGHQVRVLARHPGSAPGIEWVKGDLATGEGVREAVTGVEVVVHAATNSPAARRGRFRLGDFVRSPADVDVHGTSALLAAAERERVAHFVHVSIVGLEHLRRLPYARRKLEAEQLVRAS